MYDRSTREVVTGATSLTAAGGALVPTAGVMLVFTAAGVFVATTAGRVTTRVTTATAAAAVGSYGLHRVRVEKFVVAGSRQNHARRVKTGRTLRNQILRTAGLLRRVF